jgi:hypothetical protein
MTVVRRYGNVSGGWKLRVLVSDLRLPMIESSEKWLLLQIIVPS